MKRKFKFLFPLILTTFAVTGCSFISIEEAETIKEVVVDQTVLDNYYKDYDLTETGGYLELELQKMCFEKHTNWVTYGQVNGYFNRKTKKENGKTVVVQNSAEAIGDGSDKNQFFYTGKEASSVGTREHVWPCANSGSLWVHDKNAGIRYVDYSNYIGGGSDLYHIRTANTKVNTARGNSKFVDFKDEEFDAIRSGVTEYGENGGKWNIKIQGYETTSSGEIQYAQKCEPDNNMKGDVARIILYIYIHYRNRGYYPEGEQVSGNYTYVFKDMLGALSLQNIMGYTSDEKCMEVLKAWNKLDPPSNVEKLRNDTVQKIQGNRNPFVDYPNLVDRMFED